MKAGFTNMSEAFIPLVVKFHREGSMVIPYTNPHVALEDTQHRHELKFALLLLFGLVEKETWVDTITFCEGAYNKVDTKPLENAALPFVSNMQKNIVGFMHAFDLINLEGKTSERVCKVAWCTDMTTGAKSQLTLHFPELD